VQLCSPGHEQEADGASAEICCCCCCGCTKQSQGFMKETMKTSGSFVLQRFGAFDFAKPGSRKLKV
jgi:hypothetical protein